MQTSSVKALIAWVGCSVLIAGGIYACSSSTDNGAGGGGGNKDASSQGDDGAAGDDGSAAGDDGGSTGNDSGNIIPKKDGGGDGGLSAADKACIQSADAAACDPCCNAAHNNGGDKFIQLQFQCVCETARCNQPKKTAAPYGGCNITLCKDGGAPTASCNKCIGYELSDQDGSAGDAGCLPQVFTQCGNDPDCLGYLQCAFNCP